LTVDDFTQLYHYDSPLMLSGKLGQIAKASGTNARTGGTFVPLVTQLKYALEQL